MPLILLRIAKLNLIRELGALVAAVLKRNLARDRRIHVKPAEALNRRYLLERVHQFSTPDGTLYLYHGHDTLAGIIGRLGCVIDREDGTDIPLIQHHVLLPVQFP